MASRNCCCARSRCADTRETLASACAFGTKIVYLIKLAGQSETQNKVEENNYRIVCHVARQIVILYRELDARSSQMVQIRVAGPIFFLVLLMPILTLNCIKA